MLVLGIMRMKLLVSPSCAQIDQKGYWSEHEELLIVGKLKEVLTHSETQVCFQNGHFDTQYYIAQFGYVPNVAYDTMIAQHVCYPDMRKSLDFMASLYCRYYRFWKDDGKKWDPNIHTNEQHWIYNCDDCTYTYRSDECAEDGIIKKRNLTNALSIQMRMFTPILKMMLRGVNVDLKFKSKMAGELQLAMLERMKWFEKVLGHSLNPLSNGVTGQMQRLFYDDLQVKRLFQIGSY